MGGSETLAMTRDGGAATGDDACRRLWCAVLNLAVADAVAPMPRAFPSEPESACLAKINARERARAYIGRRDFRTVCHLAGMDPDAVAERVRQRMAE